MVHLFRWKGMMKSRKEIPKTFDSSVYFMESFTGESSLPNKMASKLKARFISWTPSLTPQGVNTEEISSFIA